MFKAVNMSNTFRIPAIVIFTNNIYFACYMWISVYVPANNPLKALNTTGCLIQNDFKTKTDMKTLPTKQSLKNLSN